MYEKTFIMNEKEYLQIEIEVGAMDEDYTEIFLIPKNDETMIRAIEFKLYSGYSPQEILEEYPAVYYMCRMYDNRIERILEAITHD